jgi:hypothetical protein
VTHPDVIAETLLEASDDALEELGFSSASAAMKFLDESELPRPTVVQAAGNTGENPDPHVCHRSYNGLTVGAHDDDATIMLPSSSFDLAAGDGRRLPSLSANGLLVMINGSATSGTSLAAPAVSGAAALIQERHPRLLRWPEGCRAILLAGARRNACQATWWEDAIDGPPASPYDRPLEGAGALDSLESVRIAGTRWRPGDPPVLRGWEAKTLHDDLFTDDVFVLAEALKTPAAGAEPLRIKVALVWNSRVAVDPDSEVLSSTLDWKLDLEVVHDGTLLDSSCSDDNCQIVEFQGPPEAVCDLRIVRHAGTGATRYGIAWTVRGGEEEEEVVG